MNSLIFKIENTEGLWMSVMLAFLLFTPSQIMAQSIVEEHSATSSSMISTVNQHVSHFNQDEFTPYQFETTGQNRLSLQIVKLAEEQQSNSISLIRNNEDNEVERRGFFHRNRYIIAGAAVAVGAGTYLLLKSDGSGSPAHLPVPPGRP